MTGVMCGKGLHLKTPENQMRVWDARGLGRWTYKCRLCARARSRRHYALHQKEIRARKLVDPRIKKWRQGFYKRHREKCLQDCREYRKKNKEKLRLYFKQYREMHREAYRLYDSFRSRADPARIARKREQNAYWLRKRVREMTDGWVGFVLRGRRRKVIDLPASMIEAGRIHLLIARALREPREIERIALDYLQGELNRSIRGNNQRRA